jgi:hypothetical protein
MIRIVVIFLLTLSMAFAAQEPRAVAEEALGAWRATDAKRLDAIAHPELKKRCRAARIVQFYVEGKEKEKKRLASGSDAEVIALLCAALQAIVPGKDKVEHTDRYLEIVRKGDLAIVVFDSLSKPTGSRSAGIPMKTEVVLKRVGDDWRFLWSPAVRLHVDLDWDPKK